VQRVTIDEVVRHINLSRRTLERRFTQVVGRSPATRSAASGWTP
jgi:transcriptional regulator GlxA family with amidase domain